MVDLKLSIQKLVDRVRKDRKLQQNLTFYGAAGVGLTVLAGVACYFIFGGAPEVKQKRSKGKTITIDHGGRNIRDQEVWVDRIEKDRNMLLKRVDQLEGLVKDLTGHKLSEDEKRLRTQGISTQNRLSGQPVDDIMTANLEDISDVRQQLSLSHQNASQKASLSNPPEAGNKADIQAAIQAITPKTPPPKPQIKRISFQLDPSHSKKMEKTVDHYVPAGSFARGVLTSGVVASTSVASSANPQPVHIQITQFGNLPRKFKADIKACFLIGSSYGDLASERVFMRLEKLSCVERKTGEVIELTVDGYVAGEDGANGLRGILVDRTGPAMRNAFIGGFVGGMGNFFANQQNQPLSIVGGGIANLNPMGSTQMLQSGAGKGLGNAMEKFADFYLKRAEQLQPVLEIEPGRALDVVFKSGFDMSKTVYRRGVMTVNDAERRDIANQSGNSDLGTVQGHQQNQGGFYGQR